MSKISQERNVETTTRRFSSDSSASQSRFDRQNHVKVAVRCRPMSEKELKSGHQNIIEFEGETKIIVHNTSESPGDQLGTKSGERKNLSHIFEFDSVFGHKSTQKEIYDKISRPIVESVLQGFNGTIFAYGQTGTGKTFTMEGEEVQNPNDHDLAKSLGIIPRAFQHIFQHISSNSDDLQFLIRASYLEIYQEEIHDLLKRDQSVKLELHERPDTGVYVENLTSVVCKSQAEIERVMKVGNQNRKVGATDMNEHSSRSHAIFTITIEQQHQVPLDGSVKGQERVINAKLMSGNQSTVPSSVIKVGKLNLVDLAGSERQRKTNSFGQRQRESIKINLSLSTLGNVINSLMKISTSKQQSNIKNTTGLEANSSFIPYRDSKLTRLLQDSLGGNAKTLMIANIGPASYNYDETINTLNYASRAKCIQNRPRLNEDPKDTLLRELQMEISDLRAKLAAMNTATTRTNYGNEDNPSYSEQKMMKILINSSREDMIDQRKLEREYVELKDKLSSLESKLLRGGYAESIRKASDSVVKPEVNVLNRGSQLLQGYTNEQELELEKRRAELAKQEDREREIRDELERRKDSEQLARVTYSSIQQEIDAKKRLIRQILLKINSMRGEIKSSQTAYRLELDELEQLQYNLQKDLKLKCLIMDNFIPNEHVDQLLPRMVYDENKNYCSVMPIELPDENCSISLVRAGNLLNFMDIWTPTNGRTIRPKTESEQISETIYPSNIRYKCENLIQSRLDVPSLEPRNLLVAEQLEDKQQLSNSNLSFPFKNLPNIQALINSALEQHEPNILI